MLALDDAALARLAIAAGRLPADQRGAWLEGIAAKAEGKQPMAGAAECRACRREGRSHADH